MKTSTSTIHLNKIFCLIGPSGSGKDTLASMIPLPQVVSYRTRSMREGEINGVHGHFISKKQFIEIQEQGLWIAETIYDGNYYGITQGELLALEESPMLYVIDWEGVDKFRKGISKIKGYSADQIVTIFLHTPRQDLELRMIKRGTDKEVIRARLDRADRDYASSSKCDYVVHNFNGEKTAAAYEIMKIILKESFNVEAVSISS